MTQQLAAGVCLGLSAAFHVWLASGVSLPEGQAPRRRPPVVVELALPPEAPPPVTLSPEPPPPQPRPVAKAPPTAAPEPVAPEPAAVEPEPRVPELTGATLVSDQAAAWSAPPGSGAARDAPIRAGLSRSQAAPVVPARPALAATPEAIPLARLGRPPVPPALESVLRRNYPASARSQGQSGEAKVRVRIEPTGHVRTADITLESAAGFGEACRRTLLSSRWTAPLDRGGRAVATWITYRCKFRVDG